MINLDQQLYTILRSTSRTRIAPRFDLIPFPQGNGNVRTPAVDDDYSQYDNDFNGRKLVRERLTVRSRFKFQRYTGELSLAKWFNANSC